MKSILNIDTVVLVIHYLQTVLHCQQFVVNWDFLILQSV